MSVAAIVDGQLAWTEALGVTNVESGEPVSEETIFDAASLSKPLFAYIVLRLAERGEFDLDRPLHEILPYARLEHDPRYTLLTARMVLSHRTGLPNWGDEGKPLELLFNPGERFQYSGEGFVYLQKVIESVTRMSLEDLARREVFEPLKMMNSHYAWQRGEEVAVASGHSETGHVRPTTVPHEANAAASLHTTARDYARFIIAWLHSSEEIRKAFRPSGQRFENGASGH
jgi:CubicO group peptidase (beta-lactamase class C family)